MISIAGESSRWKFCSPKSVRFISSQEKNLMALGENWRESTRNIESEWYHAINKLIQLCIYSRSLPRINMWPSRLLMAHTYNTQRKGRSFSTWMLMMPREENEPERKKRLLFILYWKIHIVTCESTTVTVAAELTQMRWHKIVFTE
jgi:hypothetical protein